MSFRPSRPPAGRLARLGVVLDARLPPERLAQIARMCDDAGLETLWVRDPGRTGGTWRGTEPWTALALLSPHAGRAQLGVALPMTRYEPGLLAAMAMALNTRVGGRLEISLWAEPTTELSSYVGALRKALDELSGPPGRTPKLSVAAYTISAMAVAVAFADDAVLPASAAPGVAAHVADLRAVCERAGRDPRSIGVALELPVSLGRTTAEVRARAADPIFDLVGQPHDVGLFGTLEQCQERVIELAHAGVTDLRCVIPSSADVHDVIAQLTAVAIGTLDVLMPGAPKSKPPDPPKSWGGRSGRAS
jgi:alkanesulfonate monooxygenase SsuD/methylene tetrahydromethanopterin reductase-like flavin-dependent oxidoreductase (luciferase family)